MLACGIDDHKVVVNEFMLARRSRLILVLVMLALRPIVNNKKRKLLVRIRCLHSLLIMQTRMLKTKKTLPKTNKPNQNRKAIAQNLTQNLETPSPLQHRTHHHRSTKPATMTS